MTSALSLVNLSPSNGHKNAGADSLGSCGGTVGNVHTRLCGVAVRNAWSTIFNTSVNRV